MTHERFMSADKVGRQKLADFIVRLTSALVYNSLQQRTPRICEYPEQKRTQQNLIYTAINLN